MVSEQQKTSADISNLFPMIFTSVDMCTYPKLGKTASYAAPVKMEMAEFTVDGG